MSNTNLTNSGAHPPYRSYSQHVLETIICKHTQLSKSKTSPVKQITGGKDEPNIVFDAEIAADFTIWNSERKDK
jgi:hypothetical protein